MYKVLINMFNMALKISTIAYYISCTGKLVEQEISNYVAPVNFVNLGCDISAQVIPNQRITLEEISLRLENGDFYITEDGYIYILE